MKKIVILIIFGFVSQMATAQSTESILENYAKSDEVSKMSLTGDVLRMFAKEYEQREIIDKINTIDVYIFGDEEKLKSTDITLIKANLRKDKYEDLINVRDEGMKVKIMVKEKGETIKRLFMLYEGQDSQTVVAEMKCSLTYADLQKLQLDFEGSEGFNILSKEMGKKM